MKRISFTLLSLIFVGVLTMSFVVDYSQEQSATSKQVAEGSVAPDFSLVNIEGKEVKLSDYKGKYVVLDFWGSWCGWCIKGMPEMKRMYEKYNDKIEIIGIACGDKESVWRASVENLALPWVNVRDNERGSKNSVAGMYEIKGFPTKLIIDPEGKIYKVVVGESPVFYQTIDELMK